MALRRSQLDEIDYETRYHPDIKWEILDRFGISSYEEITEELYPVIILRIRETRRIRDNEKF
jgi:hypothetical protein